MGFSQLCQSSYQKATLVVSRILPKLRDATKAKPKEDEPLQSQLKALVVERSTVSP